MGACLWPQSAASHCAPLTAATGTLQQLLDVHRLWCRVRLLCFSSCTQAGDACEDWTHACACVCVYVSARARARACVRACVRPCWCTSLHCVHVAQSGKLHAFDQQRIGLGDARLAAPVALRRHTASHLTDSVALTAAEALSQGTASFGIITPSHSSILDGLRSLSWCLPAPGPCASCCAARPECASQWVTPVCEDGMGSRT